MVALAQGSNFFSNQNPPGFITGCYYLPAGYFQGDAAYSSVANRCMYVPLSIPKAKTFAGVCIYNSGAADNGKKFRIMVFRDDGVNGGPGTLEKDFGEVTLTGAAALRTLSSSWAALPGTYWLTSWADSAASMEVMRPFGFETLAGYSVGPSMATYIGTLTAPVSGGTGDLHTFGHYVDTAYGAAPSTAVSPTASMSNRPNTVAGVGGVVAVWLKG